MFVCPNCNHTSETPCNFCMKCGSAMVEKIETPVVPETPVFSQPVVNEPVFEPPVAEESVFPAIQTPAPNNYQYNYQPIYQTPSKGSLLGKSIAGMVLSIMGMFLTCYMSILILSEGFFDLSEVFAFGFVLSLFSLPPSLIGLILSSSASKSGATNKMCVVGKILGIIGIALIATFVILGFMSASTYTYY